MNRGRIQAQGNQTEKSASWTLVIDHTKSMGIERVDNLESQLTRAELRLRESALDQARNRIQTIPSCGVNALWKKSYWDDIENKKIRVDIDVLGGIGFIDDPVINNE